MSLTVIGRIHPLTHTNKILMTTDKRSYNVILSSLTKNVKHGRCVGRATDCIVASCGQTIYLFIKHLM